MPILLTDPAAELKTAARPLCEYAPARKPLVHDVAADVNHADTVKRAAAPGRGALRPGVAYASGSRTGRLNRFDQVTE